MRTWLYTHMHNTHPQARARAHTHTHTHTHTHMQACTHAGKHIHARNFTLSFTSLKTNKKTKKRADTNKKPLTTNVSFKLTMSPNTGNH